MINFRVIQIVDGLKELAELAATKDKKASEAMTKQEITQFLMYLSAADGTIDSDETHFVNVYMEKEYSPDEMREVIENENIYSMAFESRAPKTLKRLVRLDNAKYEKEDELEESSAEKYICLYEALGMEFLNYSHTPCQQETDDLSTYIKNMRSFYRANYTGPESATKNAHFDHEIENVKAKAKKDNGKNRQDDEEETLEDLLEQLNGLIGLESAKAAIAQLIHLNTVRQARDSYGLSQLPISQHMVFYGNPGTGKTTVARLIAKIYHHLGLLSKGHLVEVDRSGLVAGYVGQTALKVKEVVQQAKGGVLFIDEAYALTYRRHEQDFGWEAVDTLIKLMEDERDDLVVIVAGYSEPMEQFIDSNPGLESRFNKYICFEDFDGDQLFAIFKKMLDEAGYEATEEALEAAQEYFDEVAQKSKVEDSSFGFGTTLKKKGGKFGKKAAFSNARLVRNYIETAVLNQADRLYAEDSYEEEVLSVLTAEDIGGIAV
ncbi:AAA family ATPase [Butyrivibrio sp.]|uniref:AAA family ATPase n=1 Tax=Butyrivibrio sp. TaxID=28121 RepID=UPI0025C616D0|nr:AAA family ATPase [Butyrivibrio sp.]MBQ9304306.1 AAA family ATPase [Butyrivibrio sp.]